MNQLIAQDYSNKIAEIRPLLAKGIGFRNAIGQVGGHAQLKLGIDEDGLPALILNYECLESFLRDRCFDVWQCGIGDTEELGVEAVIKVLYAAETLLGKIEKAWVEY